MYINDTNTHIMRSYSLGQNSRDTGLYLHMLYMIFILSTVIVMTPSGINFHRESSTFQPSLC